MFAFGLSIVGAYRADQAQPRLLGQRIWPDAPVDPVVGSFSVTFDNVKELTDVTSGISVKGLNIALDSVPVFTYVIGLADFLFIGGLDSGADGVTTVTDDFTLGIELSPTGTPTSAGFFYSQTALGVFFASTVTLTPLEPTPISEPNTVSLLSLGLASIGVRHWHNGKRRSAIRPQRRRKWRLIETYPLLQALMIWRP